MTTFEKEQEIDYQKRLRNEDIKRTEKFKELESSLLDSSFITPTFLTKSYDFKVIDCGKVKQIYYFKNKENSKKIEGYEKTKINENIKSQKLKQVLDANIEEKYYSIEELNEDLLKIDKYKKLENNGKITTNNLIRSKNQMARYVDANSESFKTFITLTFEDNVTNYDLAYKELDKFRTKIKRVFPKLLLIAVREKQKNGRVHFHCLTNIDYDNDKLINENISLNKYIREHTENLDLSKFYECNIKLNKSQKMNDLDIVLREQDGKMQNTKKIFDNETKGYRIFKTIKYWNLGFTNVEPISICGGSQNLARYMSKYMLKDMDKDLFNKHRYLKSGDLIKPKTYYLDSNNMKDFEEISKLINLEERFSSTYYDKFNNEIKFLEVLSADNER